MVDESATGSANLWSRSAILRDLPRAATISTVEPEDVRLLFEVLFDIRQDVRRAVWLLEGGDDGQEEEDT